MRNLNIALYWVVFAGLSYTNATRAQSDPADWVWVSMDAFSTDVSEIGLPTFPSPIFEQTVTNVNVYSNVVGVVTGTGITTGNIEFWPNCYSRTANSGLPGASSSVFDFDDIPAGNGCSAGFGGYGSMQVHNYGALQTIFSYNKWEQPCCGNDDVGIGNNAGVGELDWTFSGVAGNYPRKVLYVLANGTGGGNADSIGCTAASVPEFSNYKLVYKLSVPDNANFEGNVPYDQDFSGSVGAFTRIAYCLELGDAPPEPPGPCDGLGDDVDGDGFCGNIDNCPFVANASQADADSDGVGNACDADIDGAILLSSDANMGNGLNPGTGWVIPGTTEQLFANILQGGEHVFVDPSTHANISLRDANIDIRDFYTALGVTTMMPAVQVPPVNFSASDLVGVDLLITIVPTEAYTGDELSAMRNHLDSGGTVVFMGENGHFAQNNIFINDALSFLNSTMSLSLSAVLNGFPQQTTSVNAVHPLMAGVTSIGLGTSGSLSGGESLAFFNASPVLAIDVGPCATSGGDEDSDGVCGDVDVCPGGDDNEDFDDDSVPDFCDPCPIDPNNDADGDGICGDADICPGGNDTLDADGDATPDFCDVCPVDPENDADDDGICEVDDNCPIIANSSQGDNDLDGLGDACDPDDDNDTFNDDVDNCPLIANDQTDTDGDGAGDECDADDDNDDVADDADECQATVVGAVVDSVGCSIGDLCPCDNNWKNHGAYVRCVAHTSEDFVDAGLITEIEKDTIVSTAGMSSCGAKK